MGEFLVMVKAEHDRARALFPKTLTSTHEGYAVLLEEVDELWEEIKKKDTPETRARMAKEVVQVAAMCMRFYNELCVQEGGTHE
jgi:NTP pyrophosphatase (non-canonical NTP hydrolase)